MEDTDAISHLVNQLRLAGTDQFKIFIRSPNVRADSRMLNDLPYTQQLAHILVSGDGLELNIKTHFMMNVVKQYTNDKLGIEDASDRQCVDFMKEFCNVFAGKAKFMLEEAGLILGQSLPFAMQGYNEMFYQHDQNEVVHDAWSLTSEHGSIDCSISIKILHSSVLSHLTQITYDEQYGGSSGEVELF